jgi:flagellar basal body-associated protein FliL
MSAPALRAILIVSLVGLIIAGSGGFIFLRTLLIQKADDTATVVAQASDSDHQLQVLRTAERTLSENLSVEQKVQQMVPDKTSYEYQDAIALNILALAKKAGVTIKSIDYTSANAAARAAATAQGNSASTVALPGGITSTTANITFESPLRYDQWLAFVHYLEMNTMKMQIASVSISSQGVTPDGHSLITSDGFTIGVYIRNEK